MKYGKSKIPYLTMTIIAVNIVLFLLLGNSWADNIGTAKDSSWHSAFSISRFLRIFLNAFEHLNIQHVLLNMLCFAVAGSTIEYHYGTRRSIYVFFVMTMLSSLAVTANYLSLEWCGFSGVNYSLYAFVVISFLYRFRRSAPKERIIDCGVLGFIYIAMCWNGESYTFGFSYYPYDLINNLGHSTSFIVGLVYSWVVLVCTHTPLPRK